MKKIYCFIIALIVLFFCGCEKIPYAATIVPIDTEDPKLICQYIENMTEYIFAEKFEFDYDSIKVYNTNVDKQIVTYASRKNINKKYKVVIIINKEHYILNMKPLDEDNK